MEETHWWVLTMAVKLILPLLMASFKTGVTLHDHRELPSSAQVSPETHSSG